MLCLLFTEVSRERDNLGVDSLLANRTAFAVVRHCEICLLTLPEVRFECGSCTEWFLDRNRQAKYEESMELRSAAKLRMISEVE